MVKIVWYIKILKCMLLQYKINIYHNEISEYIAKNNLLSSVCPKFYSYTEPLNVEDLILHFKNIIDKDECTNFVYKGVKECQSNNQMFSHNISIIKEKLEQILSMLCTINDEVNFYIKIETRLFLMFFQRFIDIIQLYENCNIKTMLYNKNNANLINNIKHLRGIKSFLKANTKMPNVERMITTVTKIINILLCKKKNIKYKLLTKEKFKFLFIHYCNGYTMCTIPNEYYSNNNRNICCVNNNETSVQNLLRDLNIILNENINTNWFDYSADTFKNLLKIHAIITIIFEKDSFELELDVFLNIYLYYNFLLDQCYIKTFVTNQLFLIKNDIYKFTLLEFPRYLKVSEMVKSQKHLLGKMIQELSKYHINNSKTYALASQRIQKWFIINAFIEIDQNYYKMIDLILLNNNCRIQFKDKQFLKRIFQNINCKQKLHELYKKSFSHFKIQCILLFKMFYIQTCIGKNPVFLRFFNFQSCLDNYIREITKILYTCPTLDIKNKNKVLFIQEIIKKFQKLRNFLDNFKANTFIGDESYIKKFVYENIAFNLFLYTIQNNSELNLESFLQNTPYFDLSNIFFKDNVLQLGNCIH